MAGWRGAVVVALLIGTVSPISAQTQYRESSGQSATQVVSPAVVATWIARGGRSGPSSLDLLVLWRGTPGWFMQSATNSERTSGNSSGRTIVQMQRGGLDLELMFDAQARTATIQGKEIALHDANVILVDHVDTAGGLEVIGTRSVDPHLPESPIRIGLVLRRSRDLIDFLRCDVRLPDPKAQAMMDLICAQVIERTLFLVHTEYQVGRLHKHD